jgi:hypothetical protein
MTGLTRLTPRFLVKFWSDGAVVFDNRLGHTHALNLVAMQLFALACAQPGLREATQAPPLEGADAAARGEAWAMLRQSGLLAGPL